MKIVDCVMCDARYEPRGIHYVAAHGFPEGTYPVCPYCGYVSKTQGTENEKSQLRPGRELQYSKVQQYPVIGDYPETLGLLEPFIAFRSNVQQLESLRSIPMEIGWLARLWQELKDQESLDRFGSLRIPQMSEERQDEFDNAFQARVSRWFNDTPPEQQKQFAKHYGPTVINDIGSQVIWRALHSMLKAQISGAWTAVETLAGDLWVAAVNTNPQRLATLKGTKKWGERPPKVAAEPGVSKAVVNDGPSDSDERQDGDESQGVKWVRLKAIQEHGYDLSNQMGHVLKTKYEFSKLDSLRDAYRHAFHNQFADVRTAIMDPALDALCAVRNVVVHRGGVADRDFEIQAKRVKKSRPDLSQCASGKGLPITAPFVDGLVRPGIQAGMALIKAVDIWLRPPSNS